ncbi:MAG: family 20 glycosylhydrolase [Acidobacteriota bacterium]
MTDTALLVPQPHEVSRGAPWRPRHTVRRQAIDDELFPAVEAALAAVAGALSRRGIEVAVGREADATLEMHLESELADRSPEAYRLVVDPEGARVLAGTALGLSRGLTTLAQWLRLHDDRPEIGGVRIDDWPDTPRRGLMLDVSRNRVPRMRELYTLVDLMAELKLNELQLYTEHTFAYRGHETVWRDSSPMRPGQVRRLEAYARRHHVELVPNQNSFGHFHRWLIHEPYRRLAECPEGVEHPFSPHPEPFSLCPLDLDSLRLLQDLYAQLLPNFRSAYFNAGLDETLDLGRCRSKAACEERGRDRVYFDFLLRTRALAAEQRKRTMFWADILLEYPQWISKLPRDVVPMIWGYEADHDFSPAVAPLAESELDFYVCPGTASWNSFTGRPRAALANLARAARQAGRAQGFLITDWGDHGHLQPPSVSWPAYVAGAAFAWSRALAERPEELPLAALLDRHVLRDPSGQAGRALCRLGRAQDLTGARSLNGAPLFFALMFAEKPAAERRGERMTPSGLEAARGELEASVRSLSRATMERPDAGLIRDEVAWAAQVAGLGARVADARLRAGEDAPPEDLPSRVRRQLLEDLDRAASSLEPVWLARSRRGGLAASLARLTALRDRLE